MGVGAERFALTSASLVAVNNQDIKGVFTMFSLSALRHGFDNSAFVDALSNSLGIIEFDLNGTIQMANQNFCSAVGYDLSEIKGKHHSIFVPPAYAGSPEYKAFWEKLVRGEFQAAEFHRVAKGGRDIWVRATYNPIKSSKGVPCKVVKVAADVTQDRLQRIELDGKLLAISRAQAIIEFKPSGEIITANDNFLATLGYSLGEIQGQHHRMFVQPGFAQSAEYREFWARLNRGEFIASEFMRIGKGGKAVWIQASYNPVFDLKGQVTKIVKFASDVTDRVQAVHEISAGLGQLAENNLEHRIATPFANTFEKLRSDFNGSLSNLQTSMQKLAVNTQAIQSGANEIAAASDELSRRTEQQAANLEETAAALDGITVTVKKSAESAAHAREVVSMANQDAKLSSVTVGQAVNAMEGIARSAQKISQIIGVIDEIAFQTNLLALNAGVEAARAGEAGRGFAVVASEVRALAQRSAEAAKEIKTLISASGIEVENGVKLVAETGVLLGRITGQVNDINDVVKDIANAAEGQAVGLAEINTAVSQLDQVTQQNAAMAEESTAASKTLSSKAIELDGLVSLYRVGHVEHARLEQKNVTANKLKRSAAAVGKTAKPAPVSRLVANGRSDVDSWDEF